MLNKCTVVKSKIFPVLGSSELHVIHLVFSLHFAVPVAKLLLSHFCVVNYSNYTILGHKVKGKFFFINFYFTIAP